VQVVWVTAAILLFQHDVFNRHQRVMLMKGGGG